MTDTKKEIDNQLLVYADAIAEMIDNNRLSAGQIKMLAVAEHNLRRAAWNIGGDDDWY